MVVLTLVALLGGGSPVHRRSLFLIIHVGRFEETMDTLALVLVVLISVAISTCSASSLPAATGSTRSSGRRWIMNLPAFIYLLLAVVFFRIGVVPGVMASVIFAMPPAVRLTELGIRQVDREVVEAEASVPVPARSYRRPAPAGSAPIMPG